MGGEWETVFGRVIADEETVAVDIFCLIFPLLLYFTATNLSSKFYPNIGARLCTLSGHTQISYLCGHKWTCVVAAHIGSVF